MTNKYYYSNKIKRNTLKKSESGNIHTHIALMSMTTCLNMFFLLWLSTTMISTNVPSTKYQEEN